MVSTLTSQLSSLIQCDTAGMCILQAPIHKIHFNYTKHRLPKNIPLFDSVQTSGDFIYLLLYLHDTFESKLNAKGQRENSNRIHAILSTFDNFLTKNIVYKYSRPQCLLWSRKVICTTSPSEGSSTLNVWINYNQFGVFGNEAFMFEWSIIVGKRPIHQIPSFVIIKMRTS